MMYSNAEQELKPRKNFKRSLNSQRLKFDNKDGIPKIDNMPYTGNGTNPNNARASIFVSYINIVEEHKILFGTSIYFNLVG